MNHIKYCIAILLLCSGCSDVTEELSGNFFYRDEGGEMKEILNHLPGKANIYGKVVGYAYNDSVIIVKQEPSLADHKDFIYYSLREDTTQYSDTAGWARDTQKADSIVHNDPYYRKIFAHKINYWVILPAKDMLLGPMSKAEYLAKRQELQIPEKIKLED